MKESLLIFPKPSARAPIQDEGSCAGGLVSAQGVSRRLRSLKDARVKLVIPSEKPDKLFDPTAWYVAEVKKDSELKARQLLSASDKLPFQVEPFVATQVLLRKETSEEGVTEAIRERVVIRGKIFIRVAQEHRIAVLKACPYLTRYMKDPALTRTKNDFTDFARVPDCEIQVLTEILRLADGPVKYTKTAPGIHDRIQVVDGQLSKYKSLEGMKGEVTQVHGRNYVTVVLDTLGAFKFLLPVTHLAKL